MQNASISKDFAAALVAAQGAIEGAKKGKANPAFRSKYADLGACWDACREALQENGIAVLQFPTSSPPGFVGLRTILVHGPTGETLSDEYTTPLKDASNAQAMGSAITYARRYALCAVIGICPEDDDGDAAAAGPRSVQANAPKRAAGEQGNPSPTPEAFRAQFKAATDLEGMKTVYSAVKNSLLEEPGKTALLKEMADSIKKAKAN